MSAPPVARLVTIAPSEAVSAPENTKADRLKALLESLVDLAAEALVAHTPARRLDTPLLTPEQAAELLAIPRSTLLELATRGALPHYRFGRHVRFDAAELADAGRQKS